MVEVGKSGQDMIEPSVRLLSNVSRDCKWLKVIASPSKEDKHS